MNWHTTDVAPLPLQAGPLAWAGRALLAATSPPSAAISPPQPSPESPPESPSPESPSPESPPEPSPKPPPESPSPASPSPASVPPASYPSAVVVEPDLDDDALQQLGQVLRQLRQLRHLPQSTAASAANQADPGWSSKPNPLTPWPIVLSVNEPRFTRKLEPMIEHRMDQLGVDRVACVLMWVDDPAELKGGSAIDTLHRLRRENRCEHVGLGHHDVRTCQWLALNTAAHLLAMPFSLTDQQASFRAIPAAIDHDMAILAWPGDDRRDGPQTRAQGRIGPHSSAAEHARANLNFLTGQRHRLLPVSSQWVDPASLVPMSSTQIEQVEQAYRQTHQPPAPLPRSRPPDV